MADVLDLFSATAPAPGVPAAAPPPDEDAAVLDATGRASAHAAVLVLLADGCEHDIAELRAVGGTSGDRRARELREVRYGDFHVVVRRVVASGAYRYRLDVTRLTADQRQRIAAAREFVAARRAALRGTA